FELWLHRERLDVFFGVPGKERLLRWLEDVLVLRREVATGRVGVVGNERDCGQRRSHERRQQQERSLGFHAINPPKPDRILHDDKPRRGPSVDDAMRPLILVPALRVGTQAATLCVRKRHSGTQSVQAYVPTQSVGTRK